MVTEGDEQDGPYPLPAVVSVPHPSHGINETERSQWISVYRGTTRGVPARSRYTFETTFDLTGFDVNSVWVSGLILADDGVDEVRLNGKLLDIKRWTDWYYGANYTKFHPIEIRSGFVRGINRLAFVVKNETFIVPSKQGYDFPDTPNPMALRAEWQAFGRPTAVKTDRWQIVAAEDARKLRVGTGAIRVDEIYRKLPTYDFSYVFMVSYLNERPWYDGSCVEFDNFYALPLLHAPVDASWSATTVVLLRN